MLLLKSLRIKRMFLKMQIIWILSRFGFFLQGNKNFVTKICIISLLFWLFYFPMKHYLNANVNMTTRRATFHPYAVPHS